MRKFIIALVLLSTSIVSYAESDKMANDIANEQIITDNINQMQNDFNAWNAREHNWDTLP